MTFEDIFNVVERASQSVPVNLERLCKALGVKLKADKLDPQIAGQLEHTGNNEYTISYNEADSGYIYRRRFTIAHEIGHFVLHKHLIGDGIDDNKAYRSVDVGLFNNCNIKPHHEAEANRFAAALLMPENLLKQDCKDLDLSALVNKYKVSEPAMNIRLKSLGLIPKEVAIEF
jgi:Zn-dependent peptidase ImmA (M78 family)